MTTTINASTTAGLVNTADTSGVLALQTAGTTAVTVDASQNVGIGTASPNARLEVYVQRTSSTNATAIVLNDNVTGGQTNGVYKSIQSRSNNGASVSEIRFLESDGTNNNTAIAFATAGVAGGITERVRILNTGAIVCLAGGNTAATGTGIAFPSSQSASTDANTLDDYEEGTWTPTIQNFTVSGTSTLSGTYTKIGRVVYFNLSFANTGTIAFSASALITLPFTGIDSSGMIAMSLYSNGESMTSGKNGVQFVIDAPNSRFFVGDFTTTSAGQTLQFGGFYRVS